MSVTFHAEDGECLVVIGKNHKFTLDSRVTLLYESPDCDCGMYQGEDICFMRRDGLDAVTLFAGFSWDGASGPAIDTLTWVLPSMLHDAHYRLIAVGALPLQYRAHADRLMRQFLIRRGMNRIRAWYSWLAVRLFGKPSLPDH